MTYADSTGSNLISPRDYAQKLLEQLKAGELPAVGRVQIEQLVDANITSWQTPNARETFIAGVCRQVVNLSSEF